VGEGEDERGPGGALSSDQPSSTRFNASLTTRTGRGPLARGLRRPVLRHGGQRSLRSCTLGSPTSAPKAPTGSSRPSPATPTASATPATSAYALAARPPVEPLDTSMPA